MLSVSSMVAIDSLRFRLIPSFGVLATKMPPPGPLDERIRCELASRRNASRNVCLLTPNSIASSFAVPSRLFGRSPCRAMKRRISSAICSLTSPRIGVKRVPGGAVVAVRAGEGCGWSVVGEVLFVIGPNCGVRWFDTLMQII